MVTHRLRELVLLAVAAVVVATMLTVAARVAVGPLGAPAHGTGRR